MYSLSPSPRAAQKSVARALGTLFLAAVATGALAADYGNCEVSGERGSVTLQTVNPGVLTVRPTIPAPGFWNGDSLDTIKDGFEYCMAANMAHRAGLDGVKLVSISFQQLLAGQTKTFDIALSEVTITEARQKVVDFTVPYFHLDPGVLVRAGTKVDGESIKDLRIGVENGTTMVPMVQDKIKPTKPIKVFNAPAAMYAALAANQVDAVIYDLVNVLSIAKQSDGKLEVAGKYDTGDVAGGLLNKGSPNLAVFNELIQGMEADGTLHQLAEKYLVPQWGVNPDDVPVFQF